MASRLSTSWPIVSGIIAGIIGLAISFLGRGLIPGRVLGDPLPVVLSVSQLTNGLLYFNWRAPLFHLIFIISVGLMAVIIFWLVKRDNEDEEGAKTAARIATGINVFMVAILRVDAVMVGIWYIAGGLVSIMVASFVATYVYRFLPNRQPLPDRDAAYTNVN